MAVVTCLFSKHKPLGSLFWICYQVLKYEIQHKLQLNFIIRNKCDNFTYDPSDLKLLFSLAKSEGGYGNGS